MKCFLGIDTSNYTTSAALYFPENGQVLQKKMLLPVKPGEKGLRQSVPAFRYVIYTAISVDPESDSIDRIRKIAKEHGDNYPKIIGWDFPYLSQEQINVFNMHGYTAAWVLPENITPDDLEIKEQKEQRYAAVHIESPFDNPFVTIPNGYKTIDEYMKTNGLKHVCDGIIPCFETDGENMDIYIACE